MALVLMILALARPQWRYDESVSSESEFHLVFVVDISGSMGKVVAQDEAGQSMTRLGQVQMLIKNYLSQPRNPGTLSAIAFAESPRVVCPATQDARFFMSALDKLKIDVIDNRTELGAALASAVEMAQTMPRPLAIVLATDGAQRVPDAPGPLTGARIAEAFEIPVVVVNPFWSDTAETDQQTLEQVSKITNGSVVRSMDLSELRQAIESSRWHQPMDESKNLLAKRTHWRELFPHLLAGALGTTVVEWILRRTWLRIIPESDE